MAKNINIYKLLARAFISILLILYISWLVLFCHIFIVSFSDDVQKVDAIVVLGAAQWDGTPSPMFQARLDHAHELYAQGYASIIAVTGGIGAGEELSEAEVGAKYLRDNGVPSSALLVDPHGNTTFKSLNSIFRLLEQAGITSVILISHDFHNLRLNKMAQDLGMDAHISPVRTEHIFYKLRYTARESVVYILYRMFGI